MTRRGKIVLAVLALGSLLALVAATNAWFISVSSTPPGSINSALVRYLPEAGPRTFSSMLEYGNLISGSGVDPDGVPLILPGDRLLSSAIVSDGQKQTVRTSIARDYEADETVDTLIDWEVRTLNGVELTYKRRHLMNAQLPETSWYKDDAPILSPPTINPTQYDITTTTSETVEGGVGSDSTQSSTKTTTVVTTAYTPRVKDIPTFRCEVTTVKVVIHQAASITPASTREQWQSAIPLLTATETVLFVKDRAKAEQADLPTRSYLVIERTVTGGGTAGTSVPIPLSVGNLSTTESCLRIGLSAYLRPQSGTPIPLTIVGPEASTGNYYLGTTTEGNFIELLVFRPYKAENAYHWTQAVPEPDALGSTPWNLWDLTLVNPDKSTTTAVPPLPTPVPDASAPPTASPAAAAPAAPVKYVITDLLGIVSKRSTLSGVADDQTFEELFNKLYCDEVPTITVHLNYYARQSNFMEWNEFYAQDITLDMSQYQ